MKPEQRQKKLKFPVTCKDEAMVNLVGQMDKEILATWATGCALRVLPYFEERFPDDPRPRNAIFACRVWIDTGVFRMDDIRRASLASHAAAREAGEDTAARSAARAAGHAVATVHVPTHSLGAAMYARQAVWRAATKGEADAAVADERDWQYRHLVGLREKSGSEK